MAETYTKLFSSITLSTIWREPHTTRIVWITMLALADRNGYVGASVPGLADAARVTLEECQSALATFLAPDPWSRSPEHEGRRIEVTDRGWVVLNHDRYRDMRDEDVHREVERTRKRDQRARKRSEKAAVCPDSPTLSRVVPTCPNLSSNVGSQTQIRSEAEERETRASAPPVEHAAETRPEPVSGVVATIPANDSRRSVSSAHVQEWTQTISTAPKATRDQTWQLAEHVRDLARVHGVTFAEAAHKLAQAALASSEKYPFSALSLDPYAGSANGTGESWEAYQARRAADPWAGIKQ
jgi:hypothetical protein